MKIKYLKFNLTIDNDMKVSLIYVGVCKKAHLCFTKQILQRTYLFQSCEFIVFSSQNED